jgi:hypothetical protein
MDMGAAEGDLGDEGRDGEFARVVNSDQVPLFWGWGEMREAARVGLISKFLCIGSEVVCSPNSRGYYAVFSSLLPTKNAN